MNHPRFNNTTQQRSSIQQILNENHHFSPQIEGSVQQPSNLSHTTHNNT